MLSISARRFESDAVLDEYDISHSRDVARAAAIGLGDYPMDSHAVQRKTDQVAVCFFGDGATNRGPFHENLNLCAIWNLPPISRWMLSDESASAMASSNLSRMNMANVSAFFARASCRRAPLRRKAAIASA